MTLSGPTLNVGRNGGQRVGRPLRDRRVDRLAEQRDELSEAERRDDAHHPRRVAQPPDDDRPRRARRRRLRARARTGTRSSTGHRARATARPKNAAARMPMSPWAKFTTRDVRKTSTSPAASRPYVLPIRIPRTTAGIATSKRGEREREDRVHRDFAPARRRSALAAPVRNTARRRSSRFEQVLRRCRRSGSRPSP